MSTLMSVFILWPTRGLQRNLKRKIKRKDKTLLKPRFVLKRIRLRPPWDEVPLQLGQLPQDKGIDAPRPRPVHGYRLAGRLQPRAQGGQLEGFSCMHFSSHSSSFIVHRSSFIVHLHPARQQWNRSEMSMSIAPKIKTSILYIY